MRADAEYCRARGWKVGDVLVGREGSRETEIEIRYIGEDVLVAKRLSEDGEPCDCREGLWTLSFRNWTWTRSTQHKGEEHE